MSKVVFYEKPIKMVRGAYRECKIYCGKTNVAEYDQTNATYWWLLAKLEEIAKEVQNKKFKDWQETEEYVKQRLREVERQWYEENEGTEYENKPIYLYVDY